MKQKLLSILLTLFCLSLTSFAWADCERMGRTTLEDGREGLLIFCEGDDVDEMPVELKEQAPAAYADDKYQADYQNQAPRPHEFKYQADAQARPAKANAYAKEAVE